MQSEAEILIVETQEKYQESIWDSRNPAPFTAQFFAWLNHHHEEHQREWAHPVWPKVPVVFPGMLLAWASGVSLRGQPSGLPRID